MGTLVILLLLNFIRLAKLHCSISHDECHCKNIHIDDFLEEFYRNLPQKTDLSRTFSLNIEHSVVSDIDYIPKLPVNITKITIVNSFLKTIGQDAFEEYQDLRELDLSGNKLRNLLFVQHFPTSLEKLDLSKNNIGYIDNVFQKLKNLQLLDLSYNSIGILDLSVIFNIGIVNLFGNQIAKVIPAAEFGTMERVNLSRNLIGTFNETALRCSFNNLDLSYNNLTVLEITNEKSFYDLSHNDLRNLSSSYNEYSVFDGLDLSSQLGDINPKWKIFVIQELKLGNNRIAYLTNETLDLRSMISRSDCYPTIDMSNSSILDITEYYFSIFNVPLVNLSHNSISALRSNVFYNSKIKIVDLSFSQIKSIKSQAFALSRIDFLDLSHNEIEIVKEFLDDSYITEIDLSYNKIESVFSHSFEKTRGLQKLRLSDCQIQRIEAEAFIGLLDLRSIDLSYNMMHILEANTFSNLPIASLDLEGNNITSIRGKAFNNLFNMEEINLFNNGIRNLEASSFHDLPRTTNIDLRNNLISTIPRDSFVQTPNLSKVLLSGNNITHMNPLSNRLKLKYLSLTFNGILKSRRIMNINLQHLVIEDSEIKVLKPNSFEGLFNLVELYFTGSQIYFIEPGALNHLYSLKYLDTQNLFKFAKNIEKNTFRDLKSLEVLHLSSLSLEILDSYCFVGLKILKTLLINDNKLVNLNQYTFLGLNSLRLLDLSLNKIESIDDQAFTGLDVLEELFLNENSLVSFSANLPGLKSLHLEHNNISSLFKTTFLSLGELEELHLNHNNLEQISVGIFQNLAELKSLNLSYNEIRGVKNGELSNLKKLEVLDLSYNEIVKVENESVFFSLRSLENLYLDNNHLKNLDFKKLARNLPKLGYVGISLNKWKCDILSSIVDDLNAVSVNYQPITPDFNDDNINGISCIDICKFVYCQQEEDGTFHFY